DEAQPNTTIDWTIYLDGVKKGRCESILKHHPEDDTYTLHGLYKIWNSGRVRVGVEDLKLDSAYRLTRAGELRGIKAKMTVRQSLPFNLGGTYRVDAELIGEVSEQYFRAHGTLRASNLDNPAQRMEYSWESPGILMEERGSVLNPLQPLHRLPNLRPGQR